MCAAASAAGGLGGALHSSVRRRRRLVGLLGRVLLLLLLRVHGRLLLGVERLLLPVDELLPAAPAPDAPTTSALEAAAAAWGSS